jgi:uncharacterized spore protein YtfJ
MSDFDPGTVLGQVAEGLGKFAESVKVIGEPIEAAGKLIIPAVSARVGFGAGGGSGVGSDEAGKEGHGGGGGGGGFIQFSPVFLIVDAAGERVLSVPSTTDQVSGVVDKIKDVVSRIVPRKAEEGEKPAE